MVKQKYKPYPEEGIKVVEELYSTRRADDIKLAFLMLNNQKISIKSFIYSYITNNIIDSKHSHAFAVTPNSYENCRFELLIALSNCENYLTIMYTLTYASIYTSYKRTNFVCKNDIKTFNKHIIDKLYGYLINIINHIAKQEIKHYS